MQREIEFYELFQVDGPLRECHNLVTTLKADPDAAYLHLAWGAGWRGMTGDWMDSTTVKAMRELYGREMGKNGMDRFPKTRRLAVKGVPSLPMGWIRLWGGEQAKAFFSRQQEAQSPARLWLNATIAKVRADQKNPEDEVIRGKTLAEMWSTIPEGTLKSSARQLIQTIWTEKGWWDSPPGKAAKHAKKTYESG